MKKVMIFALVSSMSAAQAVVLIDDFTSGLSSLVDSTPTNSILSFQSGLSNYGGTRVHALRQNAAPLAGGVSTSEVNGGLYASNTLQSTSRTTVYWGATGITSTQNGAIQIGQNNYDFSSNRIFRVYVSAASEGTTISIGLSDVTLSPISVKNAADSIYIGSNITSPTVLIFDFTDRPDLLSPGFNFGAIDSINMSVNSLASGGYAINRVEAVPEPATMSALLLGAGMLVRRRRAGK